MKIKLHFKLFLIILATALLVGLLDKLFFADFPAVAAVPISNTLIAVIAAVAISLTIVRPLETLSNAALKVSKGDYNVDFKTERTDEIGSLSNTLHDLLDHVKDEVASAQSFQEGIHGAFYIADKNTKIIHINAAALEFMKMKASPSEVIGKLTAKDVFLRDQVTLKAINGEFMAGDRVELTDHLGVKFPALIESGPIYNHKHQIQAVFVFFTDLRKTEAAQNEYLKVQIAPLEKALEAIAAGDMTKSISLDEGSSLSGLADTINSMTAHLNKTLNEVKDAVQATASAANQISSSSEEMAAGASEQSQQTAEISASVEEMARTIMDTTKNANVAAQYSKQAGTDAEKGTAKIDETKRGMQRIVEVSTETAHKFSSVTDKTSQIGEITQVINDIADQTNLLALNAAIEAARAGEQGRGFAVVADEVRKLAERTSKATKEIADTIKAIQTEVYAANNSMNEAGKAVELGVNLTEEVDAALKEIYAGTVRVTDTVVQVAAASEEQSATAEQISKNVEGITNVTQESAAGVQQVARAAEDLSRLTLNLQELISQFRLAEDERRAPIAQTQKKKLLARQ